MNLHINIEINKNDSAWKIYGAKYKEEDIKCKFLLAHTIDNTTLDNNTCKLTNFKHVLKSLQYCGAVILLDMPTAILNMKCDVPYIESIFRKMLENFPKKSTIVLQIICDDYYESYKDIIKKYIDDIPYVKSEEITYDIGKKDIKKFMIEGMFGNNDVDNYYTLIDTLNNMFKDIEEYEKEKKGESEECTT